MAERSLWQRLNGREEKHVKPKRIAITTNEKMSASAGVHEIDRDKEERRQEAMEERTTADRERSREEFEAKRTAADRMRNRRRKKEIVNREPIAPREETSNEEIRR